MVLRRPFPFLFLLCLLLLLLWEDVVNPGQIMLGEDEVQQPPDNDEAQDLWREFRENGRLGAPNVGLVFSPSVSHVQGLFLVGVFGAATNHHSCPAHLGFSRASLSLVTVPTSDPEGQSL